MRNMCEYCEMVCMWLSARVAMRNATDKNDLHLQSLLQILVTHRIFHSFGFNGS